MKLQTGFTTHQFKVEILTPTHVGMAQEKHYQPGLDFVQDKDRLTFLNTDALFKALTSAQLSKVTTDMAESNFATLNEYLLNLPVIRDADVRQREETIETLGRQIREIRRMYHTGLGQPALPGTSLKGALRSVLLWHLTRPYPNPKQKPDELFGEITANLMRYIQLSDVAFDRQDLKVYPMKVFSGDGNPLVPGDARGEWKHGNPRNHDPAFMPPHLDWNTNAGFVNFYESLKPAQSNSQLRINIGNGLLGEWLNFARTVENYPRHLEALTGEKLLALIQQHTAQYLKKERAYYQKFKNDDLGDMGTRLDELEKHNTGSGCLLRVGANVGFHSITGDWQDISQKHHEAWVRNHFVSLSERKPLFYDKRQPTTDHIFAKTRKFGVEPEASGNEFLLPGFIKLTLQAGETEKEQSRESTRQRMAEFSTRLQAEAVAKMDAAKLRIQQAEQALKPQMHPGPATKNLEVDAEVLVSGKPNRVKIYLAGHDERLLDMVESAQQPKGYVCRVALVIEKGKLLRVRHIKPK